MIQYVMLFITSAKEALFTPLLVCQQDYSEIPPI